MKAEEFVHVLQSEFYTGVPDSLLQPLCNYLMKHYGVDKKHHVIGANEGNCVAMAAGYHLATGKYPVVYMQNSGEGNAVNPIASLLNEKVYAIPAIFVVGWRGEPGKKDEPQHIFQGEITRSLLSLLSIESYVVGKETTVTELTRVRASFEEQLSKGQSVAFVIQKGALTNDEEMIYSNAYHMTREAVVRAVSEVAKEDPIISTTGKASRELFEAREARGEGHQYDFLTVGSMGHASSIACAIAAQKPETKIWCVDGDGALIMHMGAMAVVGRLQPDNLVHILINNEAHETVGGLPTAADAVSLSEIAKACGYQVIPKVEEEAELLEALKKCRDSRKLTFLEVDCALGARADLGRPTTSARENKEQFMQYLKQRL